MRKLALAAPFLLALAACGADSKSCSTTTAPVQSPTGGCTNLAAGTTVTIQLRGNCQSCAQTSPSCTFDPVTNHLDTEYRECTEDVGCGSGCLPTQPTFNCTVQTPPASAGQVTLFYNSPGSTLIQPVTVGLAPSGGQTSCTL